MNHTTYISSRMSACTEDFPLGTITGPHFPDKSGLYISALVELLWLAAGNMTVKLRMSGGRFRSEWFERH